MFPPTFDSYRDNQITSKIDSAHFQSPKQVVGAEFYDRSKFSRNVGLLGVGLTALVGGLCIVWCLVIFASKSTVSPGIVVAPIGKGIKKEILSLALNLVVSACADAIGFAHGTALRSALASEKRLRFNTNLRLLSAASGWFNPNGTLLNVVMAVLLIVSYSSSLLLILAVNTVDVPYREYIYVNIVPLFILGTALLLQAIIALASTLATWTKILTWTSLPFDLTAALIHHAQITPVPGQCMLNICDDVSLYPVIPSPKQPSAWRAHPSIRKVIMMLWALVVIYIVWGLIMAYLSNHDISQIFQSWSFFPHLLDNMYPIPLTSKDGMYRYWALCYLILAAIQGPLTLALHCSELVVNVIRDERMWRKAMTKKGTTISPNPLASIFGNPPNFSLLLAKPLLHWMFGLAVSLVNGEIAIDGSLMGAMVVMGPSQILNYAAALSIFSLMLTTIVFIRPKGPQPAAYGHIQTLANLIDEFPSSSTMWWGDKGCEGVIRHAGTSSEHRLPEVDMKAMYA